MTYKNEKTILFASLLVAMTLLVSGTLMVEAAPNENANDKAKEHTEIDAKAMKAAGYKLFPGMGWVNANEHANVSPIYMDHPSNPGEMILDLDAMQASIEKNQKSQKPEKGVFPSHRNGYNMAAVKDDPNTMTYFNGYWKVPAEPASWSDNDTIFHFNALQPFAGVIFQPVLQYGDSNVCDAGDKWVTFAFIYINPTTVIETPCVDANVGDTIKGKIYKTGSSLWTVYLKNYGTGDSAQVQVGYSGKADTALVALETYGLPGNCSALAGDERFYAMSITGDTWCTNLGDLCTSCVDRKKVPIRESGESANPRGELWHR